MNTADVTSGLRPYRRYVIPAIILFLIVLLFSMPARVLFSLVNITQFGVYLQGVSGPWYAGSAERARVKQGTIAVDLNELRWRLQPFALLGGRLMLALEADFLRRPVAALVGVGMGSRVYIDHLRGSVPVAAITPLLPSLIFPIDGDITLQDVSVTLRQRWPETLGGKVQLVGMAATLPTEQLEIGDVSLGLSQRDDDVLVSILENTGVLGLGGDLTLTANRRFALMLSSTPEERLSPPLRQQMQFLLGTAVDGEYVLRYDGSL